MRFSHTLFEELPLLLRMQGAIDMSTDYLSQSISIK
jgi:hypothetical protein